MFKIKLLLLLALMSHGRFCLAKGAGIFNDFYDQMRYLSARDKMLSQNIENSDTPKYLPRELNRSSGARSGGDLELARTHSSHLDISDGNGNNYRTTKARVDELKRNGNGVNLDRELFKKSENAIKLNESVNIYNKSKGILNSAITGVSK